MRRITPVGSRLRITTHEPCVNMSNNIVKSNQIFWRASFSVFRTGEGTRPPSPSPPPVAAPMGIGEVSTSDSAPPSTKSSWRRPWLQILINVPESESRQFFRLRLRLRLLARYHDSGRLRLRLRLRNPAGNWAYFFMTVANRPRALVVDRWRPAVAGVGRWPALLDGPSAAIRSGLCLGGGRHFGSSPRAGR